MSFVLLDTSKFDNFINEKDNILNIYNNQVIEAYKKIIADLKQNWKGEGADSFFADSDKVYSNILGLQDRLKTMCDTLIDCREIYGECDTSLGNVNKEAINSK